MVSSLILKILSFEILKIFSVILSLSLKLIVSSNKKVVAFFSFLSIFRLVESRVGFFGDEID